ncbi:MAG TPA: hypothetical protein VJW77_04965 [Terriglobia bacterium]|nr:hypothetical protein [Terriglobia bacterium]HKT11159.1 hypothetical protein [Terriglobia bacterium]
MKAILALAFLGAVVFCALKIVPVYVENYEFQDFLNQAAVEATVRQPQPKPEELQAEIYSKAASLSLPVERQDIKVSVGQTVTIEVRYEVSIDLKIYTFPLHFSLSAQNSNI